MNTIVEKIEIAFQRLNAAIATHKPIAVFGLFSGGHDSFCASYITSLHTARTGIVHINTGIGIEATRNYVRETCQRRKWNLIEYKALENVNAKGELDPQDYKEFVRKYGFPGPAGHGMMYARLKERALVRLARDFKASGRGKDKRRIMLVSGCRSQESDRRMGNTHEVQIDGRRIWCAPIMDWSKLDTTYCLEYVNQPRNRIVDLIHKSGECLCGAFAKPGELDELGMWPETKPAYDYIRRLENEVKAIHGWGWGQRPPRKVRGQPFLPLCWSCTKTPAPEGTEHFHEESV